MKKKSVRFILALVVAAFLLAPGLGFAQVNPCAAKNPCAVKNPCAAKNPCAVKSEKKPAKGKAAKGTKKAENPCAANPCAAKNPCATKW